MKEEDEEWEVKLHKEDQLKWLETLLDVQVREEMN